MTWSSRICASPTAKVSIRSETVVKAFYKGGATSYIVKPVRKETLIREMTNLGLIL